MKLRQQIIKKLELGRFKVYTLETPNSGLIVNFVPFLRTRWGNSALDPAGNTSGWNACARFPRVAPRELSVQPINNPIDANSFIHWQAKPKYQRRWGVYDCTKDEYFTGESVVFKRITNLKGIQLNESLISSVPTSVLITDCILKEIKNNQLILD